MERAAMRFFSVLWFLVKKSAFASCGLMRSDFPVM
jgi:hypothetical protein